MPLDLIAAAQQLIAADTVSAHGNLAIVAPLKGYAAQLGLSLRVLEADVDGVRHANLLFEIPGGTTADPLLLLTHTDTVAPGPLDRWTQTTPFAAKLDGDKLYGLGSADVKTDLLCKLLALERLKAVRLTRGVFVLGTYAEEIGLLGAKRFAEEGPVKPRFVVCGEPSELTIIHAHKGYLVARVTLGEGAVSPGPATTRTQTFAGKAAHSSTPHLGENAIVKALRALPAGVISIHGGQGANSVPATCRIEIADGSLTALPLAEASYLIDRFSALVEAQVPQRDDRFAPGAAVSNVGFIEGRDGCLELWLDARLLPGHDPTALAAAFEAEVLKLSGRVRFERANRAMSTPPSSPLCHAAQRASAELGLDATLHTKATNTEAAAFVGKADAIVFGAGPSIGNAHCANEYTLVSQLAKATDWYERLARDLCV